MKILLATVLLSGFLTPQTVTYAASYIQPGNGTSPLSCFDFGEQIALGPHMSCDLTDQGRNELTSWSFGVRPEPQDGDYLYEAGEYQALSMIAPFPALPAGAALGTAPWERLYCNPATLWLTLPRPIQTWKSCPPGGPELTDFFQVTLQLPPHVVGTEWIVQWARATDGRITFSNAIDVLIGP